MRKPPNLVVSDKNRILSLKSTGAPLRTSMATVLRMLFKISSIRSLMIMPYKVPGSRISWCWGESGLSAQEEPETREKSLRSIKLKFIRIINVNVDP